jgi:hypothetical protein
MEKIISDSKSYYLRRSCIAMARFGTFLYSRNARLIPKGAFTGVGKSLSNIKRKAPAISNRGRSSSGLKNPLPSNHDRFRDNVTVNTY